MLSVFQLLIHDCRSSQMKSWKYFAMNYWKITPNFTEINSTVCDAVFQAPNSPKFWMNEELVRIVFYTDIRTCFSMLSEFCLLLICQKCYFAQINCSLSIVKRCICIYIKIPISILKYIHIYEKNCRILIIICLCTYLSICYVASKSLFLMNFRIIK